MSNIQLSQLTSQKNGDDFAVLERWAEFLEREEQVRSEASKRVSAVAEVIGLQLVAARTFPKKYIWIRKAIATFAAAIAPMAACRSGCSACCHIPVELMASEAQLIGRAIGRVVAVVPTEKRNVSAPTWQGEGHACQFLVAGECGIYEHRPLACRLLFNMDKDELLCQHRAQPVLVPYADTSEFVRVASTLAAPNDYLAELNDFFPRENA